MSDITAAGAEIMHGLANIAAAKTDEPLLAAVAGKRIRVLAMVLSTGATATTTTFQSKPSGAGSAISGLISPLATTTVVLPHNASGWFQTAVGEGLAVTTGAGATTGYTFTYILTEL